MPRQNSADWSVDDLISALKLQNINLDIDDLYAAGNDRLKVFEAVSETALRVDIGAGIFQVGTTRGSYAGATDVVVTDSATNYVMIDSTGTIVISTSAFDDDNARLAIVVAAGGVITGITDRRTDAISLDVEQGSYTGSSSKAVNDTHQAGVKGGLLRVGSITGTGNNTQATVLSDGSSPPTTVVARARCNGGVTQNAVSITIPILPNLYYKRITVNSGMSAVFFEF